MEKKFEQVKINSIKMDRSYQRECDEKRATTIARGFDWNRFGVPTLSRRADGSYWALDGQHRLTGAKEAGHGEVEILCEVFYSLDKPGEAAQFLKLNAARKQVGALDKYKAGLAAREPGALEIAAIMKRCGLHVNNHNMRNSVRAIHSVVSVHNVNGNLERVLAFLKAWGEGETAYLDGVIMKDIAIFFCEHDVDDQEMLVKMAKVSPAKYLREIVDYVASGVSRKTAASVVLRDIYNRNRRGVARLTAPVARAEA